MILETTYDFERLMRQLASQVEPTPARKKAAAKSQNYLRDLLASEKFGGRIIDVYLSGSYSRDTAIHPIDDVDIIFLIDPGSWPEGDSLFSSRPNPADVLKSFAVALRRRYERTSVYTQRRSVRLALAHLDIDVVPAIDLDGDLIEIPDARENEWIKSGPAIHRKVGAEVNKKTAGAFKPSIKLIKHWNSRLPSSARFKSFAVESMAMALFEKHKVDGIFDCVFSFFDFMANLAGKNTEWQWTSNYGINFGWFGPIVPDPSGATTNVIHGLDSEIVERFLEHAVRARNRLIQAAVSSRSATAGNRVAKTLKFDVAT